MNYGRAWGVPRKQSGSQWLGLVPTRCPPLEGPEAVNRGQAHCQRPLGGRKQFEDSSGELRGERVDTTAVDRQRPVREHRMLERFTDSKPFKVGGVEVAKIHNFSRASTRDGQGFPGLDKRKSMKPRSYL